MLMSPRSTSPKKWIVSSRIAAASSIVEAGVAGSCCTVTRCRRSSSSHCSANCSMNDQALAVLDHAANLRGQLGRVVQLPLVGEPQERLVGHRAPEEVREPGRQFMIGQLLLRAARAARRKAEKSRRTQDDAERFSQALFQGIGVVARLRPVITSRSSSAGASGPR